MKAIRFQLVPLGSASKVTRDTNPTFVTDPLTITGGPNGYSADNQECVGVKSCLRWGAD